MNKLKKEELLEILGIRFAGVCSKEEARAYEQIVELIQKPKVMEEWIREWHEKLMKFLQLVCRQNSFEPRIKHKMRKLIDASSDNIKDFIRSFVEEIHSSN